MPEQRSAASSVGGSGARCNETGESVAARVRVELRADAAPMTRSIKRAIRETLRFELSSRFIRVSVAGSSFATNSGGCGMSSAASDSGLAGTTAAGRIEGAEAGVAPGDREDARPGDPSKVGEVRSAAKGYTKADLERDTMTPAKQEARSAAQTCGLWGCGKTGTTPITVEHPEWGTWKVILVCDYHSTMVRDAR